MFSSLQTLLTSIVDYAGLFPPAQLSLAEAIYVCDRAQSAPQHWLLNRFVLPASHLSEFVHYWNPDKSVSLSVILSPNWAAELEQIHSIWATHPEIEISALEIAPLPPSAIQQVCLHLPASVTCFFEIPFEAELEPYLKVLHQTDSAAKLRTGGITPNAFPSSQQLSQRILSLAIAHIPFKATAGLHHPLRGEYHLTAQPHSETATMHGFLNVALLAVFAHQHNVTEDEAIAILQESSSQAFQFTQTDISWRQRSLSLSEIQQARQQFFHTIGSCSIQEPIDDLHQLQLL